MPRVLVANRGEIAVRVLRSCRARGWETVLAVSEADRETLGVQLADRTVCIGPPAAAQSYLKREALLATALGTGCSLLHPGYGFLAEDEELVRLCGAAGVTFVGPRAEQLRTFGDKVQARDQAVRAGVPVSPGSPPLADADAAVSLAAEIGYPLMLKAVGGGGGRGMRVVADEAELRASFGQASSEAGAAFGDDRVFLERWVGAARHVEVQVAGDGRGHVIHIGDRDCSVQRRNQKIIEEAPAPNLPSDLQSDLRASAVRLAQSVDYESVGTVEFLVDVEREEFYFLEMNPRIQVEHGVSELVTGLDIVGMQLDVAASGTLTTQQDEVVIEGAALQCRINAEAPEHDFRPSPGRITRWEVPTGSHVRVDTHCYAGYVVPPYYDSLLAKVMTVADTRDAAIDRMVEALDELEVEGVDVNTALSRRLVQMPEFRASDVTTRWLDELIKRDPGILVEPLQEDVS